MAVGSDVTKLRSNETYEIEKGFTAVNIDTDNFVYIAEKMLVKIGSVVRLHNGRDYEVVGFTDKGTMQVRRPMN